MGRRVVIFPLPFQGHITPILHFANILFSKGFSITIIHTQFNSLESLQYPDFTFVRILDGLSESDISCRTVIELLALLNVVCVSAFRDCVNDLLLSGDIACLITDGIWHFTQDVAERLKVPRIVFHPCNVSWFLAFQAVPLLRQKGLLPVQDSLAESPVPELPELKMKDLPWTETSDSELLAELFQNMAESDKRSSGLIFNSFKEFEPGSVHQWHQTFPVLPIFLTGPVHLYFPASSSSLLTEDDSCMSWLDKQSQNSVIYISFGSITKISRSDFLEIACGLSNTNQPFLWVVRSGSVNGSEWIEVLPDRFMENLNGRGKIVKWAPQREVLAHDATAGFWTHNGWNSTLESVCEGVPMICRPFFWDQMVNSRFVCEVWRVGFWFGSVLERFEIERAVKRLMAETEGREMRERMIVLKEMAQICLKQGGSSVQSLQDLTDLILSF